MIVCIFADGFFFLGCRRQTPAVGPGKCNGTSVSFFFLPFCMSMFWCSSSPFTSNLVAKKKKHSAETKFFIHLFYLVCVVWVGCLQVLRTRTFLLPNFDLFVRIETTHSFSLVPPSLLYTRWRHSKCAFGTRLMRDYLGRKSSIYNI